MVIFFSKNWEGLIEEKNHGKRPLFVYFNREAPTEKDVKAYKHNREYFDLFNITYTYRKDATIPLVYGKFVLKDRPENKTILQHHKSVPKWKSFSEILSNSILNWNISHKTKGILWIVSHCKTRSQREKYVDTLQQKLKTLSIDILGKCGKDTLPVQVFKDERDRGILMVFI